jgi:glutathione synthase/RimK-type ligase-like ATP-grasp enzyme
MNLRRAEAKLRQLQLAQRLGLRVPDTLITNDVDEALAFISAREGDVIAKAPSVVLARALLDKAVLAYTRTIKPRDLAAIGAITHVPVMLQSRIGKRLELRVTVVGERVFAAEIHSQTTRRTRDDWRQYDHAHTPMRAHALPVLVADQCRALVRELGLRYGAIDLILTPEGDYVFLEINPNGQWTWIEDAVGLSITSALCDELMRAESGS